MRRKAITTLLSLLIGFVASPASAQTLLDFNNCGAGVASKVPTDQAIKSCTALIQAYVSLRMPAQDRPKLLLDRGILYARLKNYGHAIDDYTNAINLNISDIYVLHVSKPKVKMNAFALYGRGLARLAKGDAGGSADISAAKILDQNIITLAAEWYDLK